MDLPRVSVLGTQGMLLTLGSEANVGEQNKGRPPPPLRICALGTSRDVGKRAGLGVTTVLPIPSLPPGSGLGAVCSTTRHPTRNLSVLNKLQALLAETSLSPNSGPTWH